MGLVVVLQVPNPAIFLFQLPLQLMEFPICMLPSPNPRCLSHRCFSQPVTCLLEQLLIQVLNDHCVLLLGPQEIVLQILDQLILPSDLLVLIVDDALKGGDRLLGGLGEFFTFVLVELLSVLGCLDESVGVVPELADCEVSLHVDGLTHHLAPLD